MLADIESADVLAAEESREIDQNTPLEPLAETLRDRLVEFTSPILGVKSLHAAARPLSNGQRQIVFMFSAERGVDAQSLLDVLIRAMAPAGDVLGVQKGFARRWLSRKIAKLEGSNLLG